MEDLSIVSKLYWKVEENFTDNSFFVMIDHDSYDDILFYLDDEDLAYYIVDLHNTSISFVKANVLVEEKEIDFNGYVYYPLDKKTISPEGKETSLSRKHNQLLQYLYINRHRLVTLDEIASNIWGVPLDMCNKSILSSIWVVRKAIGADNNMLQNQYNIGYKLNIEGGGEEG